MHILEFYDSRKVSILPKWSGMRTSFRMLIKLSLLSIGLVSVSEAAEVRVRTCLLKLVDDLHARETGEQTPLSIVEFKLPVSGNIYFDKNELQQAPVPLAREIFGLYRRPVIARAMQRQFQTSRIVESVPEKDLPNFLEPIKAYTYVIHDDKVVFAQTRPGRVRDFASKHALLRDQESPLRMAGEMWVDDTGKFHIDASSGTFQPQAEDLLRAQAFFRDHLGIQNIEAHQFVPPLAAAPTATAEARRLFPRFNMPLSAARSVRTAYAVSNLGSGSTVEEMEGTVIEVDNKKYKVIKTNSVASTESIYDTANLELTRKGAEFRTSENKLDESSSAVSIARRRITPGSSLTIQAREEIQTTEYGLFPVTNGVVNITRPAGYLNLEKSVRTGVSRTLSGKREVSYQAEFEGDPALRSIFEQRLGLQAGTQSQNIPVINKLRNEDAAE